jgi:CelD/BcsL family acetyltransferase involved in cellulose biosynthesis
MNGVRQITGHQALTSLDAAIDDLHTATAAPVTARRPWLETWIRCHPQYVPWVVVVDDGADRLRAAAPLAWRRRAGMTEIVAIGHGASDDVRLPARDAPAAFLLAAAVAIRLAAIRGPWRLLIGQLRAGDEVAVELADRLPRARLVPADPSPVTRFTDDRSPRTYVSRNHHQQVRRMLNRMQRDGLEPQIEVTRDPQAIAALLPAVEQVCRRRDATLHRRSPFEDPIQRRFFYDVVSRFAEQQQVELLTVRLDRDLACYVLCFLDQVAYRMWSCRFDPRWQRYGVGRVGNHFALTRALSDPGCAEFDWMRGDEPYKFSMSNAVSHAVTLIAWSGPLCETLTDAPRQVRSTLKPVVERHQRLQDVRTGLERAGYLIGKVRR